MATQSKASSLQMLQQPSGFSSVPLEVTEAILTGLLELSLYWERPLSEEAQLLWVKRLRDLTPAQIEVAFERAANECKFFPAPAVLREYAGIESQAQRSEREARDGLNWLLWRIRRHGLDHHPSRGELIREAGRDAQGVYHPEEYEWTPAPSVPDAIRDTLYEFGGSDAQAGAQLVAQYPLLKTPDDYPDLGLRLSAMEKLEARWIEAWRKANPAR